MYTALHIQDAETDRLARELSAATGETITEVVRVALRERSGSLQLANEQSREDMIAGMEEIVAPLNALPVLDNRSPDEIVGYNEHGLFD